MVMLTPRIILFGLVAAQLLDAMTFTFGVSRFGIGLESNGIAVELYRGGGLAAVLLVKGAVLVSIIAMLVTTAQRFPRLLVWVGAAGTGAGLLGFAVNSLSMAIIS